MTANPTRAARGRAAQRRGQFAETLCALLLRLKGYAIVERRLKGRPGSGVGEIDLIARRGRVVAFVEVKARADEPTAAWALSAGQRRRLERAARLYLARHPALAGCEIRFDAMLVGARWWPRHLIDAWRDEG